MVAPPASTISSSGVLAITTPRVAVAERPSPSVIVNVSVTGPSGRTSLLKLGALKVPEDQS
jgi:hypothetical protein